jgi:hypothetical protein
MIPGVFVGPWAMVPSPALNRSASCCYWLMCTTVAGGKPLKCVLLAAE